MPSPSLVVATSLSRPWQLLLAVVIGPGLSSGVPTAAAVIAPPSASHNNNVGHATAQNTVKILVCGDSITQGADGDFTWRYRLWEWFQANAQRPQSTSLPLSSSLSSPYTSTTTIVTGHLGSAAAQTFLTPTLQFVGPYNGTLPASVGDDIDLSDPQTWGRYHATVDAAFWPGGGSQHFAVYGRPAWMDIDLIAAHVAQQQPDVVVLHLGFNDVGWWSQTAPELVATMHRLVQNARRGRPDVAILVADVSHRLLVAGREDIPPTTDQYNALLAQNALVWSTEESPVWVVKVSEDYDCEFLSLSFISLSFFVFLASTLNTTFFNLVSLHLSCTAPSFTQQAFYPNPPPFPWRFFSSHSHSHSYQNTPKHQHAHTYSYTHKY